MKRTYLNAIWALAALLSISLTVGCADVGDVLELTETANHLILDGPEAKQWLAKNGNESALASNRFNTTKDALTFVERLYLAGATMIRVPQDSITADVETLNIEGGPYADALLVTLPDDAKAAQRVYDLCVQEIKREGFDAPPKNAKEIFLWWD